MCISLQNAAEIPQFWQIILLCKCKGNRRQEFLHTFLNNLIWWIQISVQHILSSSCWHKLTVISRFSLRVLNFLCFSCQVDIFDSCRADFFPVLHILWLQKPLEFQDLSFSVYKVSMEQKLSDLPAKISFWRLIFFAKYMFLEIRKAVGRAGTVCSWNAQSALVVAAGRTPVQVL